MPKVPPDLAGFFAAAAEPVRYVADGMRPPGKVDADAAAFGAAVLPVRLVVRIPRN